MENKDFDQSIRKHLEQREIKPSSKAWDRIQNELEQPNLIHNNGNKIFVKWSIAAGFAFILGFAIWNFFPTNELPVVITPQEHPTKEVEKPSKLNIEIPVIKKVSETQIAITKPISNSKNVKKSEISSQQNTNIIQNVVVQNEEVTAHYQPVSSSQTTENIEKNIQIFPTNPQITVNLNHTSAGIIIDEKALLQDIEDKIQAKKNKTTRQKIIETLKTKAENLGFAITN